ncbi:chorismate mutase [Salirhabdus euzebyi]|uniref:chorismate mutase n=1 Tax=Salirhabdus euzebyi TaxID=394506 RepID=A0A841PTQ4_9BACI|nr:chorismate mutase [Salirhabdus euzebyi]MBB6452209.1 chorismate mutase [Salirhabdus euzebyi]
MIRGIRGATTVKANEETEIIQATKAVLEDIAKQNNVVPDQIASILISVTHDLNATFPAKALRLIDGWKYVPVMCTLEIPVPNSLPRCIRIMVTTNTNKKQEDIQHIYHHDAKQLRPDLVK